MQQQPEGEANLYKAIQLQAQTREALDAYYNGMHGNREVKALVAAAEQMFALLDLAKKGNASDERIADLQQENRRVIEGAAREGSDAEAELAPALGYKYDEEYGWITGDHTSVTLAMEASRKIAELEAENERLRGSGDHFTVYTIEAVSDPQEGSFVEEVFESREDRDESMQHGYIDCYDGELKVWREGCRKD